MVLVDATTGYGTSFNKNWIREAMELEMHPNNMNGQGGLNFSKSSKILLQLLKERGRPPETQVISLPSHGSSSSIRHRAISPAHNCLATGLHLWQCPPPVPSIGHPPLLFQLAQASFEQTFTCKNTLVIWSKLFFFTQPMKTEQTECFEMSIHKIQKP